MSKELRLIEVSLSRPNLIPGTKGYFHSWSREPYFITDNGFHISKTFALIEFFDGRLMFVEPEAIRFTEPYAKKKASRQTAK